MSLIDNDYQTALLFKQFVGVAAARLDDEFSVEKFRSVPNIFSNDVMIEEIPSSAPIKISGTNNLDASSNWLDSSCNYGTNTVEESTYIGPGPDYGKTFAEIYPDTNLKFYKRLSLVPCEQNSNGQVWGSFTDYNGTPMYTNLESVLKHSIPFKYDDTNATYSPVVQYNRIQGGNGAGTGNPNFQETDINSFPLYWVMDAGTGFLQMYQSQTNLEAQGVKDIKVGLVQDKDWAPKISVYVYNGKRGITNLDVSGQVQVGDISGINTLTEEIERMVILDGSAVVTQIDLCGNDTLRAQYEYIRKNLFVGYPTHPILTDYQVDHAFDPSQNGIYYELDISGNSYISGNVDISSNLGVTGTLSVDGNIQGDSNANIGGDLFVDGIIESIDGTRFVDYRKYNSDISGSIMGSGNSQWYCVAKIDPGPAGEFANAVFILDDDTSGLRQSIIFRAGSSYSNGNFIDVLTNHFYSGPKITGIRIDTSGNDFYQGANLYIQRGYTTNPTRLFIRVYQNKRKGTDGTNVGWWQLTSTPIPNLNATRAQLNLDFNPSGNAGGSKATTLDTLIDAQLKVNDYTTIQNGQFVDISGMNIILRDELNIKDTNILVKGDIPEIYLPSGPPNNVDYYEIAFINQDTNPPGTGNAVDCVTSYFTFTNNLGSGAITDSKQSIHFIAGIYYSGTDPVSFIKVLSNNFNKTDSHVSELVIAEDPTTRSAYLILGFDNQSSTTMENCEIRMYKNSNGEQTATNRYNGGGWVLGNSALGATTNNLLDISTKSVYPNSPYSVSSATTIIKIDSSVPPNAYSNLFENFLRPVDISANARIRGNLKIDGDLAVDGVTNLNKRTIAQDISCVRLHINPNSTVNEGLIIENSGSGGGPQIALQQIGTTSGIPPAPRYHKIYVDDPTDDLHIDINSGSGGHTLFVDSASGTFSQIKQKNTGAGPALVTAENGGGTSMSLASSGGRGKIELTSASTNEGIWIGTGSTTTPESRWYIGGSGIMTVGLGISLKSLTETAGTNPTFATGEVRINANQAGSGYEDIDFAVNTLTTQNALLVDAANNTVNIKVPFSVDADVTIDGNLQVEEDLTFGNGATIVNTNSNTLTITEATTAINGNLTVSGTTTLNDLSFSSMAVDIADLPNQTYINNRGVFGNYKRLTSSGHQEFLFDTQNVSPGDWISIAYVGPKNETQSKKQRATGKFEFINPMSSCHQTICAYVNFKFGDGLTIDIIKNVRYSEGSRRQINAFRIAYANTFDGGIFQMQIRDDDASTDYVDLQLKISENWDDYGWWCDLSGSPSADNSPVGYMVLSDGTSTNVGSAFTTFWPSEAGVQVLDRQQNQNGGVGHSTLMYTSDMVLNKVYMDNDLDMSGNVILNASLTNPTFNNISTITTDTLTVNDNFNLPRDSIANMVSQLSNHSLGIATNVGIGSTAYKMDALIWKPTVSNSITTRILTNEQYMHVYTRDLAGDATYGGLTGFSVINGQQIGTKDYSKYTASFSPSASYARLSVMPTSSSTAHTIDRPITSFLHLMKKIWITGIYLNTPFCPRPNQAGNLFQWGVNSYVDVQIRSQTGWESVYRMGNPSSGPPVDSYFFPSSSSYDDSSGGIRVTFPADEWKFVDAGTNMSDMVRFNFYAGQSSNFCVAIIDESTDGARDAEIDGYITFVQEHPLAT